MIEITKKLRDNFYTDSDVEDYAEEQGLSLKKLFLAIALYDAKGTPCEKCANVEFHNMYPCVNCSQNKKNYYRLRA